MSGNSEQENKDYLDKAVRPVLEKLIPDLLIDKPKDLFTYLKKWLEANERTLAKKLEQKKEEKKEASANQIPLQENKNDNKKKPNEAFDSNESDEEEEEVKELTPIKKPEPKKQGRTSVSAEVYGVFNKKAAFKPRVIKKVPEQTKRIKERLEKAFMFQALDEKDAEIVIGAMEEKKYKYFCRILIINPIKRADDFVIKQGDDGGELYVVDSGELNCMKRFKPNAEPTFLKVYKPGESFGELSLLYNAPRAASIQAKTDCILWALDRETFNNIVKDAAVKRRERYENFLQKVELLDTMDPYERMQLADGLQNHKFKAGEFVVRQGDPGDKFYMVEEGNLVVLKVEKPGEKEKEVYNYKEGDYFGELALLKNIPRQASIQCKTDVKLVSLDKESFKRMLGPLEEILKRNEARYAKYANK